MKHTPVVLLSICLSMWGQPQKKNLLNGIPLSFEPAPTQSSSQAEYVSRGAGYSMSLSSTKVALESREGSLQVKFVGANRRARIEPLDPLPGISNYFLGNDRSKWRTDVPHFGRVAIRDVYPGGDLIFYGHGQQLEYDAGVAPRADPRKIRMSFSPAQNLKREKNGDVVLQLGESTLRLKRPMVYQEVDSSRIPVAADYSLRKTGELAFDIGRYHPNNVLIIDPVLVYSTYFGGVGQDLCQAVAVDSSGNVYITGNAHNSGFPLTVSAPSTNAAFTFVAKISAQGSLVYSTYILSGGCGGRGGTGITIDTDGNAYVTGVASSGLPTVGPFQASFGGGAEDAFVAKLNPQGNALIFSSYLGGTGDDSPTGIAIDPNRNVYVTGQTTGGFPIVNAIQASYGGSGDAFVAKINPQGSALIYSTYLGGSGQDRAVSIAADSTGNAYVTGSAPAGFPTANALTPTLPSTDANRISAFVTKLNPSGSGFVYSTYLGGSGSSQGSAVTVDASGNAYVSGIGGAGFPSVNPLPASYGTNGTAFVTKINPLGTSLIFSTFLGSTQGEARSLSLDTNGNLYIAANVSSGLPLVNPIYSSPQPGIAAVLELNPQTNSIVYSTYVNSNNSAFAT